MPEPLRRAVPAILLACLASTTLVTTLGVSAPTVSAADDAPPAPTDVEAGPGTSDDAPADVAYDVWFDRWGQSVADVPDGADPWGSWDLTGVLESPVDTADQYAMRMRTLLTPHETGTYRFAVSGDDDARLFLNPSGDDPIGARQIAYVAGWTTYRQFDRFASQRSEWFALEAGRPYYVEVIGKEGSFGDHFTVAWERQDGFGLTVVPPDVLETTQLGSGGWRSATPSGLPSAPSPMTDPGWQGVDDIESLSLTWNAVAGADWYEVRLEGAGEARQITVEDPAVSFDGLVPETRYLVEVSPANPAARMPAATTVRVTASGPYPPPVAPTPGDRQSVSYDRWETGWWTLTSVPFGEPPASTGTLNFGFETPPMRGDNHAARIRAVLSPAVTGDYTFFLSADDDARLFLNADGVSARGATRIASVAGWTEQYQWDRYQSQRSATFRLEQGGRYYIEAISVHALGLDHLEVGWSRDGGPIEVIPNAQLSPTEAGGGGWRTDPTSLPNPPGSPVVAADGGPRDVVVGWTAPDVDERHGAPTFYEVTVHGGGLEQRRLVSDTSAVFDGLGPDTEHTVTVTAWNAAGPGTPVSVGVRTDGSGGSGGGTVVSPPTAGHTVLATGTSTVCQGIEVSGSSLHVDGSLRSNGGLGLYVSSLSVNGTLSYGGTLAPGSRTAGTLVHDPSAAVADLPDLLALLAGKVPVDVPVHRHDRKVVLGSAPAKGIHLVQGDVTVAGSRIDLAGVTIIATGVISVSGSGMVASPAANGLPSLATTSDSCGRAAIGISGSGSVAFGPIVAPNGLVRLNGSAVSSSGSIVGAAVRISGSQVTLGGQSASLLPDAPSVGTPVNAPLSVVVDRAAPAPTRSVTSAPADRAQQIRSAGRSALHCPAGFPVLGDVCHR